MKSLRFIAFISTLIMMAVLCIWSIAATGIERTVLSESYYREILVERKVIENIRSEVLENLPEIMLNTLEERRGEIKESEKQGLDIVLKAVQNAAYSVFDTPWMEEQVMGVIPGVLKYLKGENKGFHATIYINSRIEKLKKATAAEFDKIDEKYLKQAGMEGEDTEKFAQQLIDEMDLPHSVDIGQILDEVLINVTQRDIGKLTVLRRLSYFVPYALAIVFCITFCLMYGMGSGFLRIGLAIFIPGITMTFTLITAGGRLPGLIIENAKQAPNLYIIEHAIKPVVDTTIQRFVVTPIIFTIAGALLIAAGTIIIIKNKHLNENVHHAQNTM